MRLACVAAVLLTIGGQSACRAAAAVDTTAKQAILIDITGDIILFEKNADERMAPSSMSKIMTMYMVFDALKKGRLSLEDRLLVSERAWRTGGSKMFVDINSQVRVEDLIRGVIIQSGNDATVVLAEALAGSEEEFARQATAKARELGLTGSNFKNANGLPDPEHYSTARDLALLARHLITDFPDFYHYYSETEFVFHSIKQQNRNPLLYANIGADGLKTGHTSAAGYGLTGSAVQDGRRLILVINGVDKPRSRAEEAVRLMTWGFRSFRHYPLLKTGEAMEEAPVWMGATATVPLVVSGGLSAVMTPAQREGMKVVIRYNAPVPAPIVEGTPLGSVLITAPDTQPREVTLLAGRSVEKLGFVGRIAAAAGHLLFGWL